MGKRIVSLDHLILDIHNAADKLKTHKDPKVRKLVALVKQQNDIFEMILDQSTKNVIDSAILGIHTAMAQQQARMANDKLDKIQSGLKEQCLN